MGPPSLILARHLILVSPESITRDSRSGQVSTYDLTTGTLYLGSVEQSGMTEVDEGEAIRSEDTYSISIFSIPDPQAYTQYAICWRLLAPSENPVYFTVPGTIPDQSTWDEIGVVQGNATKLDYGCWSVSAKVIT
jgi:hypothetical protein